MDYSVLGDSIILAQRLESAAPTGQTYVGDITHRLTKNRFEFEWVGELTLKGKAKPVPAWRLVGERPRSPGAKVAADRDPVGLIGREDELARAARCLDDLMGSRGGLLMVLGEAGVGKSRLKNELAEAAARRGQRWMEAQCPSHAAGVTYAPFAQLIRTFAQIAIDQAPELAAEALGAAMARVGASDSVPYFARLLGLPPAVGGRDVTALGPEAFRRGLHDAFSSWLSLVAAIEPLVVVVEDCHWLDASGRALAQDLLRSPAARRFLLLLTARPEGADVLAEIAGADVEQPAETIALGPLPPAAVELFLQSLLDGPAPRQFAQLVVDRAGGNPFFVEELVRALHDEGALVRGGQGWQLRAGWEEGTVPPSLEGVLSARIDLLPVAARRTLLEASVLGRRVPRPLLDGLSASAPAGVPILVDRGFLDVVPGDAGELEFHHALVQEAAYSRLLRRQRQALHRHVAALAEELYGAGDDVVDLLARHGYLGAIGPKAIDFLIRAGERAARLFANDEAILHLGRGLELARTHGDEHGQLLQLLLTLGDLQELTGNYDAALAHYREASDQNDDVRACRGLASVYRRQGRYREAARVIEDAFVKVRPEQTAPLWLEQAWTLAVEGRAEETVEAAQAGLAVATPDEPLRAHLLLHLAQAELIQGSTESALGHAVQAQQLMRDRADLRGLTTALRVTASIHTDLDDLGEAAVALREGLALSERTGNVEELAGCLINLGLVEQSLGNLEQAIECDRRAIAEFERIGHGSGRAIGYANLSEKLRDRGDLDEALRSSETASRLAHAIGHAQTVADALQTRATIHLKRGEYLIAAERAEEAVLGFLELGAKVYAAEAAQVAADAWGQAGYPSRAAQVQARVSVGEVGSAVSSADEAAQ